MYKLSPKTLKLLSERFIIVVEKVFARGRQRDIRYKTKKKYGAKKSGSIALIYPSIIGWQHCFQTEYSALKRELELRVIPNRSQTHIHILTHISRNQENKTGIRNPYLVAWQ